ncbi:UNVERIFIED_CONTAM: hypothetical protein Slati_0465900 [Sesamum latifolium]|uniref:Uncharacterized protein n=1 Tax=Sesamum latifolium TaxID=2727402 RepID=A0AAW2XZF9_9LAMI
MEVEVPKGGPSELNTKDVSVLPEESTVEGTPSLSKPKLMKSNENALPMG